MLTIHRMTLRDIPLFNSVRNECRAFLHDTKKYTLEESADWFRKTQPDFGVLCLAYDEGDDLPIGYFRTSERTATSVVVGLDIHKDFRGRGLAREAYKVLFHVLKCRSPGLETFELRVRQDNTRARHLYEALGFVYMGEPVDGEFHMVRPC